MQQLIEEIEEEVMQHEEIEEEVFAINIKFNVLYTFTTLNYW